MQPCVRVYTDYKSPYAYVANRPLLALEQSHGVTLEWLPYTLRIADYLGAMEARSPHQWRRVRYSYMDARRYANAQGLVLKGPQRVFNGYLASVGMLFAQRHGFFPAYHETVFARFWARALDLDAPDQMQALIAELGGSADAFAAYADGPGRQEHDRILNEAEELGVFGVPTMVLDGELFWGGDRIDMLRQRLEQRAQGGAGTISA